MSTALTPLDQPRRHDATTPRALPCTDRADLFFADAPDRVEQAKALCVGCPVVQECLDGALLRAEVAGVWGGQLLVDGQVVARKRPRGRPRKHAA